MPESLIWQVAVSLLSCGVVYGGIRADLRSMRENITRNEKAIDKNDEAIDRCNNRMNDHMQNQHNRRRSDD